MQFDLDYQISKSFTLKDALYLRDWELCAFPQTDQVYRNILQLSSKLQLVRDYFDKPLIIHCWYRPREYNKHVKGAKQSLHINGSAADFHIGGISVDEALKEISQKLDEWQIRTEANFGKSWCHIDLGYTKCGPNLFNP